MVVALILCQKPSHFGKANSAVLTGATSTSREITVTSLHTVLQHVDEPQFCSLDLPPLDLRHLETKYCKQASVMMDSGASGDHGRSLCTELHMRQM